MDVTFKNGSTFITRDGFFEPDKTFNCGQCFRFEKTDGGWRGIAFGRELTVLCGDFIELVGVTEDEYNNVWKGFFDLDRDYGRVNEVLSRDAVVKNAMEAAKGIRILRQDGWETLCSFIISQNNNIPRIKGIISRLCLTFGERVGECGYSFPTANRLAPLDVEQLAPLRAGFRAKYILDAARRVADGSVQLDKLEGMDYASAREQLMQIKGVGAKVADCTLLFGFGFLQAFPKDVWIKRVIEKYYGSDFDEAVFAPYGGIAQQYLFYAERGFE